MRILIAREKHGPRYLDASSDEALARSSLKLLRDRLCKGYYPEPDEAFARPPERPAEMDGEAFAALPPDIRHQLVRRRAAHDAWVLEREDYADWRAQVMALVVAGDLRMVTIGLGRYARCEPLAYHLLSRRSDHEYEGVSLEDVEPAEDAA